MLIIQPKYIQIKLTCYDTYATLKKINKQKLKFKSKPWITLGLQKSISVKNKLFTNFINKKDPILKEEFHANYKKYRNLFSILMKKSKQAYYDKYFERNGNNIKAYVCYFLSNFYFSPNDSPSKTLKNIFYFI